MKQQQRQQNRQVLAAEVEAAEAMIQAELSRRRASQMMLWLQLSHRVHLAMVGACTLQALNLAATAAMAVAAVGMAVVATAAAVEAPAAPAAEAGAEVEAQVGSQQPPSVAVSGCASNSVIVSQNPSSSSEI